MNKQNRGDAPAVPHITFAGGGDPLHSHKRQEGFEQDNISSGNLRDHNGCKAGAGVMATKHYDNTTGAKIAAIGGGGGGKIGSVGGGAAPSAHSPSSRAYQGPNKRY